MLVYWKGFHEFNYKKVGFVNVLGIEMVILLYTALDILGIFSSSLESRS